MAHPAYRIENHTFDLCDHYNYDCMIFNHVHINIMLKIIYL